jgi:nucleoside 2-deoxyribosyltransferase
MPEVTSEFRLARRPTSATSQADVLVYLAGPITGLSYSDAVGWRDFVIAELARRAPHVRCLDPMRAKEHPSNVESIGPFGHAGGLLDGHAVVQRDLWDVARSDVLLMNLAGAESTSIGCMVELGWAKAHGRFTIVVLPPEERGDGATNPHDHLFVHELASAVVADLQGALAIIETM